MKILHLGGKMSGGGASKIFSYMKEVFPNDYFGGVSEIKLDINFEDVAISKGIINNFKVIFSYNNFKKLYTFLNKNEINIVHLQSFNGRISTSILLALRLKRKKIKIIQTMHEYQINCPNSPLFNFYKNEICCKCIGKKLKYPILLENCSGRGIKYNLGKFLCYIFYEKLFKQKEIVDCFIVPSHFAQKKLIEEGIKKEKIVVIENPVEKKYEISQKVSKEDIIVYFGRFSKEKGVDTLINVIEKINSKKDIKLILIGEGREKENYEEMIRKKKLNKIEWYPFLTTENLIKVLEKAKISVLPSKCYETFGLTIIESIFAKIYPIAREQGAMKENILSTVGECFFTEDELEIKILKILENYDTYQNEIEKKYDEIIERYSLKKYKNSLEKLYSKILDKGLKK